MNVLFSKAQLLLRFSVCIFSLIGILSLLNIIYIKPWNNPELSEQLRELQHSSHHSALMVSAARLLQGSVPDAKQAKR